MGIAYVLMCRLTLSTMLIHDTFVISQVFIVDTGVFSDILSIKFHLLTGNKGTKTRGLNTVLTICFIIYQPVFGSFCVFVLFLR